MTKHVAENGDPAQRSAAIRSLAMAERMRMRRTMIAAIPIDTPSAVGMKRRQVFDAKTIETLPGNLVRTEGSSPVSDVHAEEAYDGAGLAYDLMHDLFNRNSIDGNGMQLDSTIHYGRNYDNAFWDGRQMVYGDGDGKIFNRFTGSIDVIVHEHWHGVTQHTAQLVYWEQSGALNEHMSDVFGSVARIRLLKAGVKNYDWLIGAGMLAPGINGTGLRSMKDPGTAYNDKLLGKDPQPGHMKDYIDTADDSGGVHLNSGIPNKAFYLACEQLDDYMKPAQIWYATLCKYLRSRSQFTDMAAMSAKAAADLYGANSTEQQAIQKAWGAVGVS